MIVRKLFASRYVKRAPFESRLHVLKLDRERLKAGLLHNANTAAAVGVQGLIPSTAVQQQQNRKLLIDNGPETPFVQIIFPSILQPKEIRYTILLIVYIHIIHGVNAWVQPQL